MRINTEHIRIADQFVEVPSGTNNNNYANVHLIVEDINFGVSALAEMLQPFFMEKNFWGMPAKNPFSLFTAIIDVVLGALKIMHVDTT
ncbi:hypothetical protein MKW92_018803 [Papaver armeniacum]|nr:hypothetical protein MKW92_018803 [Papaver armeniacum]